MEFGTPYAGLFVGPGTWLPGAEAVALCEPSDVAEAHEPDEAPALLARAEEASRAGCYVAAFVTYEAGRAFGLPTHDPSPGPIAWMAAYPVRHVRPLRRAELPVGLTEIPEVALSLQVTEEQYAAAIGRIHRWIERGHTYQVNYTCRARLPLALEPLAYFLALAETHPVPYAAYLAIPGREVLSLSPELFLERRSDRVISRPMKGTRPRRPTAEADRAEAEALLASEKERAENLMIVDMVRNDLGHVARTGSVAVPELFALEQYRSVWQMTGTVTATLRPGVGLVELFAATFPGASITGAPKLRTMEIIRELEDCPRGLYTGALGLLRPGGDCVWNLPIRTLVREPDGYALGVGAGIVWDSRPDLELAETRAKARFALRSTVAMELFETLLLTEAGAYRRLEDHLARLARSADYWGYPLDLARARERLAEFAHGAPSLPRVVRLALDSRGRLGLGDRPVPPPVAAPVRVLLSPATTSSDDPARAHKTTLRGPYDRERAEALAAGYAEALFRNETGCLTEGAITSLFARIDGVWCTPPVSDGLLPGIWRAETLRALGGRECSLRLDDLARATEVLLGNAVRGAMVVDEVYERVGEGATVCWRRPGERPSS